ncbi:MAG: asparagine synthase (glutamine-hydrolyzing) [Ruminococcus sp.]|jgi:asparagine synthase (glutamine-hydrolysing)
MCGIAGFYSSIHRYLQENVRWRKILDHMNQAQKRRGPDEEGICLYDHCGLAHVRLSIIDLNRGRQPMTRTVQGKTCTVSFNGEIYNMPQLRQELEREGAVFTSDSDTEVILQGYLLHGKEYVKELNGIFSIALWDVSEETLYLFRDRVGVKPLFYTCQNDTLIFASELKGIFAFPGIEPVIDRDGLCEIFALGPAKTYGKGVFRGISEVLPGHYLVCRKGSIKDICYWKLQSSPHEDSFEKTVEKTAWLIEDSVKKQMLSDIPISTFLSGGVDSSLVTAICAAELKKQGKILNTFSFDFTENQKYFRANSFQPSQDRPWADKMAEYCGTNHHHLECSNDELIENLFRAVKARDLPCMADVESSMLYFCSEVAGYHKVTLTGECADEIFGGYPWFHSKKAFETAAFPWSDDMKARQALLRKELIRELPMKEYALEAYEKTVNETPVCNEDTPEEKRRREIAYLNLKWFMATLLDRMDRTSMYSGLEARVPLADHRIVEYVWNVPWKMKCPGGLVKGLLRYAGRGKLPDEILFRRKSPYPKTYHPEYEKQLGEMLLSVIEDPAAPIRSLLDKEKLTVFLNTPSDYGRPWYGQLMAGPQMLAYMLQVNYWLKKYKIRIIL